MEDGTSKGMEVGGRQREDAVRGGSGFVRTQGGGLHGWCRGLWSLVR